jgi:hypothetical protein
MLMEDFIAVVAFLLSFGLIFCSFETSFLFSILIFCLYVVLRRRLLPPHSPSLSLPSSSSPVLSFIIISLVISFFHFSFGYISFILSDVPDVKKFVKNYR